jgi:hypothetical protein
MPWRSMGDWGVSPCILKLYTRRRQVVIFTTSPLSCWQRAPGNCWTVRRSGWFGEQKNSCPCQESNDGSSVHFVAWAIPQHFRMFMLNVAVGLTVCTKYHDTWQQQCARETTLPVWISRAACWDSGIRLSSWNMSVRGYKRQVVAKTYLYKGTAMLSSSVMDLWARSVECSSAHYTIGRLASGLWHLISVTREILFTVHVRGIWRFVFRAVSCRPFMAEAPVRSYATPCKGFSQKSGSWPGF